MPYNSNIRNHFRLFLMSVTLLWALMLNGQEVVAYASPAHSKTVSCVVNSPEKEHKTVVKQKVSLEATTSFVALNLQQALEPVPFPSFAAPTDEVLPNKAILSPGAGFAAQLFPITIQPNAP
ncbi:RNA methyltransferase [Pontibacter harenae]|uniref:RNA methyltransferase n=1 Tax=Pontibacter harenae TaxID=2894083 RepID=UPI001E35DD7F|nr:RNA methyltransferase [Pontibacter harenae]MCC9165962.1 RNA methyltransferase [Pontibacter harenae]